jgi:hypothetical protein
MLMLVKYRESQFFVLKLILLLKEIITKLNFLEKIVQSSSLCLLSLLATFQGRIVAKIHIDKSGKYFPVITFKNQ